MSARAKVLAGAVAVAAVLSGCGSDDSGGVTLQQASSSPTAAARQLPDAGAPVAAGTYTTTLLQPQLSLTLPAGFAVLAPETAGSVTFGHPSGSGLDGILAILRPSRVVDPAARLQDKALPDTALVPVPTDLVAFFAKHPGLEERGRGSLEVDGKTITTIDVDVPKISTSTCVGGAPDCLSLLAVGGQTFSVNSGMTIRNYIVPTDAGTLSIGMLVLDPKNAPNLFAQADAVIGSLDLA